MHKHTTRREPDDDTDLRAALADPYRRFVVYDLTCHYHPVPVYDLADRLSAWEASSDLPTTSYDELHRRLLDEHLPLLREAGLVEAVGGSGTFGLTARGKRVEADERGLDLPADDTAADTSV